MRKFLRMLRKGFKTACLTTALVTCWNIGHATPAIAAPAYGEEVTMKFSGTISPTANDLSNVYLIYCTGTSSSRTDMNAIALGDFTAGQTGAFSVTGQALFNQTAYCLVAGVYGDDVGVTLNINGPTWIWDSLGVTEETMLNYLINDDMLALEGMLHNGYYNYTYFSYLEGTRSINLYDYSSPSANGTGEITTEIIPEPASLLLFGTGGYIISRFQRRNED